MEFFKTFQKLIKKAPEPLVLGLLRLQGISPVTCLKRVTRIIAKEADVLVKPQWIDTVSLLLPSRFCLADTFSKIHWVLNLFSTGLFPVKIVGFCNSTQASGSSDLFIPHPPAVTHPSTFLLRTISFLILAWSRREQVLEPINRGSVVGQKEHFPASLGSLWNSWCLYGAIELWCEIPTILRMIYNLNLLWFYDINHSTGTSLLFWASTLLGIRWCAEDLMTEWGSKWIKVSLSHDATIHDPTDSEAEGHSTQANAFPRQEGYSLTDAICPALWRWKQNIVSLCSWSLLSGWLRSWW